MPDIPAAQPGPTWLSLFRPGRGKPPPVTGDAGPAVQVVNQWALTFSQPASFQMTPPALQSVVVALAPANSVGGGTGTATAGTWLVALVAMSEQAAGSGFTVNVTDDIPGGSYWRPGDETTSTWAVSTGSALMRTAAWYTANTARAPGYVYVAPNGPFKALAVLVVEVAGLGPWDTVAGISTNYAAAATSLSLSLPAPAGQALIIGAVSGDSTTAGQAFQPAGWNGLHTTTVTNGTDHTTDSVLTAAYILTSSAVAVTGTASSATDLSGVLLSVLTAAPSPVPGGQNANWPFMVVEAAFGSGYQTPADQMTWTTLNSITSSAVRRFWGMSDSSGVPYGLGQLQSSSGSYTLSNPEGALCPWNTGSPYYSTAVNGNMSFQSGVSPWTAQNGATLAQSAAQVFTSAAAGLPQFSLQVTPNGSTATPGAVSEQFTAAGSTAYSASAWFYSVAGWGTGAQVAISWYTSGHALISTVTSSAVAVPAATWTQVTLLNQTSPANAAFATVTVQFSGTPSAAAFWVAEAALNLGASAVTTGRVTTGTPIRLRAALGTIKGATYNRWYLLQRNADEWPERRTQGLLDYVPLTTTDAWSVAGGNCPSPFRGEIRQDAPQSWWPMDDQPLAGGVLPGSLRNAAAGNANPLLITQSAAAAGTLGAGAAAPLFFCNKDGWSTSGVLAPSSAVHAVAQQQGWCYGDPQSSPQSYATGNPVTSSPGSAAWQTSGQAGTIGSAGWYLYATDASFPPLSGGVTVECWFNYQFYAGGTGFAPAWTGPASLNGIITQPRDEPVLQQPTMPLTILELATASLPVAVLQLDQAGHLNLLCYNGSTAVSNPVYAGSDLRSNSWHHVAVELTTTTWKVFLDGGANAAASGSATGMTSAWTALVANGDLGTGGSSSTGLATAFVQSKQGSASATSVTITLDRPTTAGNCLVVGVSIANANVSGITLGGSADHFAAAKTVVNGGIHGEIWTDANCTGGQTSVVISIAGGVAQSIDAWVMEFSGIATSSPVDQTASNTGSSVTTWSSGTTGALASPSEIAVGIVAGGTAITGPGASWANSPLISAGGADLVAGWAPVASAAGQVYQGYTNSTPTAITYAAAIVTLKAIGLAHGGNVALSHLKVYPSLLPAWRVAAHYWAAFTGFGQIPAPQGVSMQWATATPQAVPGGTAGDWTPDGSTSDGGYRSASGGVLASAVVTAVTPAGLTSGPSPWATATGFSTTAPFSMWTQWTGLAPAFNVYTGPAVGTEKRSAVTSGSGDSFINGYQNGALGEGSGQTSGISLVQWAATPTAGSASPVTVNFRNPVTAGNCLVACIGTTDTSIASITIGGSADHWAQAKGIGTGSTNSFIWVDPNCAGGGSSVVVTTSPGAAGGGVVIMELSGVATASPVDQTAGQAASTGSSPVTWTSTATGTQAQASDVAIGMVYGSIGTISINLAELVLFKVFPVLQGGQMLTGIAGLPGTGAVQFDGTATLGTSSYTAAVVTLKSTWAGGSPPASASATGDTVAQRLERILYYGMMTGPRAVDSAASLLVHAATDIGGQQAGANCQNMVDSDNGLLYTGTDNVIRYRSRPHLAADTAAWTVGMNTGAGQQPFGPDVEYSSDPQRIYDVIGLVPFSPEGGTLATLTPANAAAANAAQAQYGPKPKTITSYLQDATKVQAAANWWLAQFGGLHRRGKVVTVDAAEHPAGWPLVLGINPGDLVSVYDAPFGVPANTVTYRVSQVQRTVSFGAPGTGGVTGKAVLTLDPVPSSYWS